MKQSRTRFWVEMALAMANAGLLVLTVLWNEWIEIVFHIDPDAGSGALEWSIIAVTLALTVMLFGLARLEWRRFSTQLAA